MAGEVFDGGDDVVLMQAVDETRSMLIDFFRVSRERSFQIADDRIFRIDVDVNIGSEVQIEAEVFQLLT